MLESEVRREPKQSEVQTTQSVSSFTCIGCFLSMVVGVTAESVSLFVTIFTRTLCWCLLSCILQLVTVTLVRFSLQSGFQLCTMRFGLLGSVYLHTLLNK